MAQSRWRRAVIAVACAAAWLVTPVRALDPGRRLADFAHDAWRMDDGLPQESVTSLVQTRDGYLWFGTLDGLVRFDGTRFEVLNLIHLAGLEANAVLSLGESPDGALWIGTRDGLARYEKGSFTVIGRAQGLTDTLIRCVAPGRRGGLWVGTRAGGLNHLRDDRWTSVTVENGLAENDVRSILEDARGTVWIGTTSGLTRMRGERVQRVPLPGGRSAPTVLALSEATDGAVWVGTTSGLWVVAPGADAPSAPPLLADRQVRALVQDPRGGVWAGTSTGLARVLGDGVEADTTGEGLARSDVRSLLVDRESNLWVGTDSIGLHRLRDASVVMVRPNPNPDGNSLMSVLQDASGAMWMTTNCAGVVRWTAETARVFTTADGLPDNCGRSLARAPDGSVWAGTVGGLAHIAGGRVVGRLTVTDGLSSNRIMSLAVDRAGVVWAGTTDAGLNRIEAGRVTHFGTRTGLNSDDVRVILETRDGTVWVGTYGGGIWRIRGSQVTTLTRRDGLSNGNVLALLEDPDGTVWIGTNGGGLNRWRQGQVTVFAKADGLFSDGIFQVLDDGRGALWLSAATGVFRVDRTDLEAFGQGDNRRVASVSFTTSDGLRSGSVMGGAQPAGWTDTSGHLWFPTVGGAAVIDPTRLVRNPVPPPVHIERILVDRNEWPLHGEIRLPAGTRLVEFQYTALSFAAPDKVRFRFQLEGFDRAWADVGVRRAAYFTNLAPGSYRFRVTACNNDGVWNEAGAAVGFVVLPYFYQTRLFRAAVVTGLAVLLLGAFAGRMRQLRRRERALARQVDEALAQVKVLSGLLPTCASCKRIRDDAGEWRPMEIYIRQHSQADFSHGICPDCMRKLYPDYGKDSPQV